MGKNPGTETWSWAPVTSISPETPATPMSQAGAGILDVSTTSFPRLGANVSSPAGLAYPVSGGANGGVPKWMEGGLATFGMLNSNGGHAYEVRSTLTSMSVATPLQFNTGDRGALTYNPATQIMTFEGTATNPVTAIENTRPAASTPAGASYTNLSVRITASTRFIVFGSEFGLGVATPGNFRGVTFTLANAPSNFWGEDFDRSTIVGGAYRAAFTGVSVATTGETFADVVFISTLARLGAIPTVDNIMTNRFAIVRQIHDGGQVMPNGVWMSTGIATITGHGDVNIAGPGLMVGRLVRLGEIIPGTTDRFSVQSLFVGSDLYTNALLDLSVRLTGRNHYNAYTDVDRDVERPTRRTVSAAIGNSIQTALGTNPFATDNPQDYRGGTHNINAVGGIVAGRVTHYNPVARTITVGGSALILPWTNTTATIVQVFSGGDDNVYSTTRRDRLTLGAGSLTPREIEYANNQAFDGNNGSNFTARLNGIHAVVWVSGTNVEALAFVIDRRAPVS
jgi:hypothetical protein